MQLKPRSARPRLVAATVAGALGAILLCVNLVGLLSRYELPSRSEADIDRPLGWQPVGRASPDSDLMRQRGEADPAYFQRLAHAIHRRTVGFTATQLRGTNAPALWDNWILHLGRYVHPSLNEYEFVDHRRALARGWGLCSQSAAIVFDVLLEQGYARSRVLWPEHTVVEARTRDRQPYIIDSHLDVVLPFSIRHVRQNPRLLTTYYSRVDPQHTDLSDQWNGADVARWAQSFYRRRPVEVLSAAAYPRMTVVEPIAYALKWIVPLALLAAAALIARRSRRAR